MKLQQLTKLISKNVTILSIASAFVLGAVGMTDIKDNLFDTSKWFMKSDNTEQNEFENIAADSGKPDFEFAKPTQEPDDLSIPSDDEPDITSETIPSVTTSETTAEPTVTIDLSDMTLPEMTIPTDATSETFESSETSKETTEATTENTKDSDESTKKTKKTKTTEDTTKAPDSGKTTEAPKETTKKAPLGDTSGSYNDDMAKEVLGLVNQIRADNGLAPLSWSGSLVKGAKSRATEIVVKWAHKRPDGSDFWDAPGCEDAYGENLGKGYGSAAAVVDGWMNSPTHKANILKSEYKTLGVACYLCNGTYYWVQEFGC